MKNMNKKGFTLAELLIVVAIIAVLTVVAVPIFTTQLEKSRENTDIANMREAKAAAAAAYLGDELDMGSSQTGDVIVYFDANDGKLVRNTPTIGYGKGTGTNGGAEALFGYQNNVSVADKVIKVTVHDDGSINMEWVAKASTSTST